MIIPKNYKSTLDLRKTQEVIKFVKDTFQVKLAKALNLQRVTAPLFVRPETGLNDNLNGTERPVSFDAPPVGGAQLEIVHSLAKWKRLSLGRFGFGCGEGIYTDMNAIRRDEDVLDNLHSMYVDQWDWEKVISKEERNTDTLKNTVRKIYAAIRETSDCVSDTYGLGRLDLPEDISFITSQELLDMYPDLTAKEREYNIVKDKKAVFLMQIGKKLSNGEKHDGRAPDYDDWELNGDILVYYPLLDVAFEISSMGIRVDENSLVSQCREAGAEDRLEMAFHKGILDRKLPYTIGGGIGQSRLCMLMLGKAHIGEVQSSVWDDKMIDECKKSGIELL